MEGVKDVHGDLGREPPKLERVTSQRPTARLEDRGMYAFRNCALISHCKGKRIRARTDSSTCSLTPITSVSLTIEATHTLVNALQTATDELNIQVCISEGVAYRRNSVVMNMRVLKEHQGLGVQERKRYSLVEVFAT